MSPKQELYQNSRRKRGKVAKLPNIAPGRFGEVLQCDGDESHLKIGRVPQSDDQRGDTRLHYLFPYTGGLYQGRRHFHMYSVGVSFINITLFPPGNHRIKKNEKSTQVVTNWRYQSFRDTVVKPGRRHTGTLPDN